MPQENDSALVPFPVAQSLRERAGGSADGAQTRPNSGKNGCASRNRGRQPPYGRTMAAMVAEGFRPDSVLEIRLRPVRGAPGAEKPALIVARNLSSGNGARENDRAASLHSAPDHNIRHARNLRSGIFPQRTPVDSKAAALIGSLPEAECGSAPPRKGTNENVTHNTAKECQSTVLDRESFCHGSVDPLPGRTCINPNTECLDAC
jgi:hypothetical protein